VQLYCHLAWRLSNDEEGITERFGGTDMICVLCVEAFGDYVALECFVYF
jgi:hypothetical protein